MIRILLSAISHFVISSTVVPILWTDEHIPEISISIVFSNNTNVTGRSYLDLSSPSPFTISHESFLEGGSFALIKLIGNNDDGLFQFESRVSITNRQWTFMSGLDLSPDSPFSRSARSYMITPSSLVIRPLDHSEFCSNSSRIQYFDGRSYHANTWSFVNRPSNHPVFIDSAVSSITLSESDYDAFIDEVLEIGSIEVYAVAGYGMVIADCDIDALDEILPVFQYSIPSIHGVPIHIELSAKQYLITPSHERICHIAIEIANDSRFLHLGSILFRKYSLLFENNSGRIGICEEISE